VVVQRRAALMPTYRTHRLDVLDGSGTGWCVVIHPPGGSGRSHEVLRIRCRTVPMACCAKRGGGWTGLWMETIRRSADLNRARHTGPSVLARTDRA